MKLSITSPYPVDSLQGNSVSARRIADLVNRGGHSAHVYHNDFARDDAPLIALNAWRSAETIQKYIDFYGTRLAANTPACSPGLAVVMTGSDLFPLDGIIKPATRDSIQVARAVVMTHTEGREQINHPRIREIGKSIVLPDHLPPASRRDRQGLCGLMVAHLREQKNPFLFLRALPQLEPGILVQHYGNASEEYANEAKKYQGAQYQWLDEVPRLELLAELKQADFLLNTSHIEGSSNAICEAIYLGIPVIASAIAGNTGVLGNEYPGLFRAGDAKDLARILNLFKDDLAFREQLKQSLKPLAKDLSPEREQAQWLALLAELAN